jgi:hypothetical protein
MDSDADWAISEIDIIAAAFRDGDSSCISFSSWPRPRADIFGVSGAGGRRESEGGVASASASEPGLASDGAELVDGAPPPKSRFKKFMFVDPYNSTF